MAGGYHIRAYCPNRLCVHVHYRPYAVTWRYDAAYTAAEACGRLPGPGKQCPACGTEMGFYPLYTGDSVLDG
ncbi:hypothetical protein MJA45_19525 [Paenibacillus aurantius]|uniref:Uncharacterized protein n=1 Tax=Paenibacillus aurantius TaxID=2918900 RepID=A0AA96LCQ0_9BACL|nr:hypothetical protein [Paenibacillus aurantius]WNQ09800.1 hypothetical protein MJA45_19525 [Paenibacillus aurantius]